MAVVGCVHGDEPIGRKVIQALRKVKVGRGKLMTVVANAEAVRRGVRFVDADLNRSFPGRIDGNREERLAYELRRRLAAADYVIDIHSTVTDTSDLAIVTRRNGDVAKLVRLLSPKRVAIMPRRMGRGALIHHCHAGISIEYGKEGDRAVYDRVLSDVLSLLFWLGMTGTGPSRRPQTVGFYEVTGSIRKRKGIPANPDIRNFEKVRKGSVIASDADGRTILAKEDFYPVLFDEKAYESIYGFTARKVDSLRGPGVGRG